ncbi:MAG: ABC transporter ATP-binding protein [bacterium]
MNLEINNLGKEYKGHFWGLKNFNLKTENGVVGLLGPNGAGKSTLMRVLATVTKPTEGKADWNGTNIVNYPDNIRMILGYLPQDFGIYPNLNAVEFLSYLSAARGLTGKSAGTRISQLLELVNLVDARHRKLVDLSGGMKQRVGIAQALLNDPKLLIVDEPTAGLDPEERIRFRNLLSELSGDRIVILSSHIVSDIEAAATSIAIMNKGRLLIYASPEELLRKVEGKVWEAIIASAQLNDLRKTHIVGSTTRSGEGVKVRIVGENTPGEHAKPSTPTLEDAYLYILTKDNGKQSGE